MLAATGPQAGLANARHTAGFRANHLALRAASPAAIGFDCRLGLFEITGSETFLHLTHDLQDGSAMRLWPDPAHACLFTAKGLLAAPAPHAMAA